MNRDATPTPHHLHFETPKKIARNISKKFTTLPPFSVFDAVHGRTLVHDQDEIAHPSEIRIQTVHSTTKQRDEEIRALIRLTTMAGMFRLPRWRFLLLPSTSARARNAALTPQPVGIPYTTRTFTATRPFRDATASTVHFSRYRDQKAFRSSAVSCFSTLTNPPLVVPAQLIQTTRYPILGTVRRRLKPSQHRNCCGPHCRLGCVECQFSSDTPNRCSERRDVL